MPDKPLTVFTYAASASLAAVALVYFFHPSYLFDGDSSASSAAARKRAIVGLHNPANDCFINCVLQSLAGINDLRSFVIRENHRRNLVSPEIYDSVPAVDAKSKPINAQKLRSLQTGQVTKGLKEMIDRLNERPLYRKSISAMPFIRVLEHAFGSTISKSQQDAQEFLQLVAERLCEEYHAGKRARKRWAQNMDAEHDASHSKEATNEAGDQAGFPLEGKTEGIVECTHCHFIPKASPTSFVMLNLMVPQKSSSTLSECFDAQFKTEYIDDYQCDKCRLSYAVQMYQSRLQKTKTDEERAHLESDIEELTRAIENDPEKPPTGVSLPDSKNTPKRRIGRHVQITSFPKTLIIHLSRSIFDPRSYSMKNSARVTFPEQLPLGSLLDRKNYKLLGLITHKGTHNSGHYETFRRQQLHPPLSNPHTDKGSGPYSPQPAPPPITLTTGEQHGSKDTSRPISAPPTADEYLDQSTNDSSTRSSGTHSLPSTQPSSAPDDANDETPKSPSPVSNSASPDIVAQVKLDTSERHSAPQITLPSHPKATISRDASRLKRKKKPPQDRWWRISDDKVKECKTADVLGMTREVYMLFYEME